MSPENVPAVITPQEASDRTSRPLSRPKRLGRLSVLAQVASNLRSRLTMHPLFLDMGLTGVTGAVTLIAGLLAVSLFGKKLGAVALGEYLLVRRVYSWLQSMALLGVAGALPRYVAYAVDKPARERASYLFAAIACAGTTTACCVAILHGAKGTLARWLFGSIQMTHLVLPLSLLLVGGAAQIIVYGYYRGRLSMKRANALQLCTQALVPLGTVLALFHTGSAALILSVMGVSTLVCGLLFAVPIVPEVVTGDRPQFRRHALELLRYGIPRLPGGFGLGGFFALGAMIASHYLPIGQVSSLLLGGSFLLGVSASADPLSLILLSKFSMVLAQNRLAQVRIHLEYLQSAVLELYVFACLQLVVFADVLVRAWVGPRLLEGIVVIRLCLLAIPFYLLFGSLRSIIDAASVTAYNTYNTIVSFLILLVLIAVAVKTVPLRLMLEGIAGAQVIAIVVLAWLTSRAIQKLYDVRVSWKRSVVPLLLGVVFGGTSLLLHWARGFQTGLGQFLLIELVTGTLFLVLLAQLRSPWLAFFWNLAFPHAAQNRAEAELVDQRSREN